MASVGACGYEKNMKSARASWLCLLGCLGCSQLAPAADSTLEFQIREDADQITLSSSTLEAVIRKRGYVSGVYRQSFLDLLTGFRDPGFGLDIVDWLMEPGSDEGYRDQLPDDLKYVFGNLHHGNIPKRSIEGPQICTKARVISPVVIRGGSFVAVKNRFRYTLAAPGKRTGSEWNQTLVFPAGQRYFLSCDKITSANDSDALFLRIDMPGHIKHKQGDTFSEVYLSYLGKLPSSEFFKDFAPDEKFLYRRGQGTVPQRFIRACHLRDPRTGAAGPWLAGMTLDPAVVSEAWCHQRGYVCMIEEFGGRRVKAGQSFSAVFVVGYFDSIEEMHNVFDQYAGAGDLAVDETGWRVVRATGRLPR